MLQWDVAKRASPDKSNLTHTKGGSSTPFIWKGKTKGMQNCPKIQGHAAEGHLQLPRCKNSGVVTKIRKNPDLQVAAKLIHWGNNGEIVCEIEKSGHYRTFRPDFHLAEYSVRSDLFQPSDWLRGHRLSIFIFFNGTGPLRSEPPPPPR